MYYNQQQVFAKYVHTLFKRTYACTHSVNIKDRHAHNRHALTEIQLKRQGLRERWDIFFVCHDQHFKLFKSGFIGEAVQQDIRFKAILAY